MTMVARVKPRTQAGQNVDKKMTLSKHYRFVYSITQIKWSNRRREVCTALIARAARAGDLASMCYSWRRRQGAKYIGTNGGETGTTRPAGQRLREIQLRSRQKNIAARRNRRGPRTQLTALSALWFTSMHVFNRYAAFLSEAIYNNNRPFKERS